MVSCQPSPPCSAQLGGCLGSLSSILVRISLVWALTASSPGLQNQESYIRGGVMDSRQCLALQDLQGLQRGHQTRSLGSAWDGSPN